MAVTEEVVLNDYPSLPVLAFGSFILIIIYFVLTKILHRFPALGFSTESKGGDNEGQKPNDISFTGAYKIIVISIQEVNRLFNKNKNKQKIKNILTLKYPDSKL